MEHCYDMLRLRLAMLEDSVFPMATAEQKRDWINRVDMARTKFWCMPDDGDRYTALAEIAFVIQDMKKFLENKLNGI